MVSKSNFDKSPWLVAVHGGAGYHSKYSASEKAIKNGLRSACNSAIQALRNGSKSSVEAVEDAIRALEDVEYLNAGYGSNLTVDGSVECDASIIDAVTRDFGSVGAVQGVKNPISLARAILQNSTNPRPLGRVPPITLTGSGARSFAKSCGLQLVEPDALISENSRREWEKWKSHFESAISSPSSAAEDSKRPDFGSSLASVTNTNTDPDERRSELEDTVGAVACGSSGGMAAGVSSGGLLLKYPGRIGEAAVFGAGVWAYSPPELQQTGVACSVSGAGEAIIRTAFARSLAETLLAAPPEETHNILQTRLEAFCEEVGARGEEANVGVLVVTKEPFEVDSVSRETDLGEDEDAGAFVSEGLDGVGRVEDDQPSSSSGELYRSLLGSSHSSGKGTKLRLWCAFTTESMAIGYASSEDDKPRALIMRHRSRRNAETRSQDLRKRGIHITALPLSR